MNNLTQKQNDLINLITNEFKLINENNAIKSNDIFDYIDKKVNEKKRLCEELRNRNVAYKNLILQKFEAFTDRISNIVNRYGYTCAIDSYRETYGIIEYAQIKIRRNDVVVKEIYLYTDLGTPECILSYISTDFKIYRQYPKYEEIQDCYFDRFIANLMISELTKN